jgi:hypothetical protein
MPKTKRYEFNIRVVANVNVEDGHGDPYTYAMGACLRGLTHFRGEVLSGRFEGFNVTQSLVGDSSHPDPDFDAAEVTMAYVMDEKEEVVRDLKFTQEETDDVVLSCVKGTHAEKQVKSVIAARVVQEAANDQVVAQAGSVH